MKINQNLKFESIPLGIEEQLNKQLKDRELKGNRKFLQCMDSGIDFFSNDYLGLSENRQLISTVQNIHQEQGKIRNGSTGSRLLSGNTRYCESLEKKLSETFQGEGALLFNSGYNANLSVFSSIPQKGDTIVYDENIHASIKDGIRLSYARYFSFRHNNLSDLERKLKSVTGNCFVAVESIYSMDGDHAPLTEILKICKANNAYLIVDEAHSTGFYKNAGGYCEYLGIQDEVFIRIYTFGKAIGIQGACTVTSEVVKDYLVNFARQFIYTTALPMHNLITISCAFDFIKDNPQLVEELNDRIAYFRSRFGEVISSNSPMTLMESHSPVQAILYAGNEAAKALANQLQEAGICIRPILPPTVKKGAERLRVCLHSFNTNQDIDYLINALKNAS